MYQVDPRGILSLIAVAMCFALAVLLYRTGAKGSVARKLGLLLAIEGVALGTSDALYYFVVSIDTWEVANPKILRISEILHHVADCAMLAFYPPFLARTLQTPLTRPFAGKRARIALVITAVALYAGVELSESGLGGMLLFSLMSLLFIYALIAALHAWHRATGIARTRAGFFILGFGIRDICWGIVYAGAVWSISTGNDLNDTWVQGTNIYAMGTLLAIPVIAYGILRTQLFDIDLRIRWTIKQSTLAGIFVAVMFLISEGASEFLSAELGSVAGLLAAAVLMFFLAPLQRFAERVANTAMPNTKNTPEYASFRKMQVYEAALSEAQAGGVSQKERTLLEHLRQSLGISESDAEAIEAELQA